MQLEQQRKGSLDEVRYFTVDGVNGLLVGSTEAKDTRYSMAWDGIRNYKGKRQFVWLRISMPVNNGKRLKDGIYDLLNSTKLIQD